MKMNFYMPTKVVLGDNCVKENGAAFKALGRKAMLVTGANSAKRNGAQDDVIAVLEQENIAYTVFDRIRSNPDIDSVYEGAEVAKREKVDFIISIGGGSPMDAGKAIALLTAQDVKRENLFSGKYDSKVLPMVHIPTTAGTGSEVTPYAILTNDSARTKTSISSPILFPKLALCDPKYMLSLSREVTINTAIDALSHAIEGMLTKKATPVTDMLAVESIQNIVTCYVALKTGELTLEQRGSLLYASTLAGMVIAHTGTTAVHSMGYSLTYFKDIDHGRANGITLPSFMQKLEEKMGDTIASIYKAMGIKDSKEMTDWMDGLLGEKEPITREEIEEYASISVKAKNIKNCRVELTLEEVKEIYMDSFGL
jgi:alcohol dehydrogenase class IV